MILADTSVWIDHLRANDPRLAVELSRDNILMHKYVLGELSLCSLNQREKTLAGISGLPTAIIAHPDEVRMLIQSRSLYSRGIGYIDAHLIASALLMRDTALWTRDRRFRIVAESLKIHVQFP